MRKLSIALAFMLATMIACTPAFGPAPSAPTGHSEAGGIDDSGAGSVSIQKGGVLHTFAPEVVPPQHWHVKVQVNKCGGEAAYCDEGSAYEITSSEGNTLLMAGANALWQGLSGVAVTGGAFTTTNAALAVSDAGGGMAAANLFDIDVGAGATTIGTSVSTASCSAGTITITTSAAHGLTTANSVGQVLTVSGIVPANTTSFSGTVNDFGYNGTFSVASVPSTTTFTYTIGSTCPAAYSSGGTVKTASTVGTPTALSESSTTVTVTVGNSLSAGQVVQLLGMTPSGYNGTWIVASATGTSFTYTNSASGLAAGSAFGNVYLYNKYRTQANGAGSATITNNQIQYVATVGTSFANYAWNDWALDNSCQPGCSTIQLQPFTHLFNHAFPGGGLGTKTSAASWTLTVTFTVI